ncbi:MAG TPA: PhoU domain-containing protein [Fermentimonas sp.]|nr:PhoU domain-containing protein [Fermentimonas sp.]
MNTKNENTNPSTAVGIKDKYLEQLHSDFLLLSEIVLTQMIKAEELVHDNHNKELVLLLKRNEKVINSLDVTIKEKVINAIMLFTPRASDLRRLMAYHDMTISMERVGDLIENIRLALVEMDFTINGFEPYKRLLSKMFSQTDKMLRKAIFAFSGVDNDMAYDTILMDDKVDKLERKIERKLSENFNNQVLSTQSIINMMHLTSISYYLERIGDKAVDIAESAVFLIEGKDIRHDKVVKVSKKEDKDSTETEKSMD